MNNRIFKILMSFKCKSVALEMNPEYYALCIKRVEAILNPPPKLDGEALGNELKDMLKGL
jgi:hypothetical protein